MLGTAVRASALRPRPANPKLFMLTFAGSLVWIGFFAFLLVWWTDTVAGTAMVQQVVRRPVMRFFLAWRMMAT